MNDWFSWNGKKCTEYGIHVLEQPPITIPAERATFANIPGRPGSLTTLEGDDVYDDLILTAQCMISDPGSIRTIASYLKGSGKVTFANRPGGFYFARIVNQIPFEKWKYWYKLPFIQYGAAAADIPAPEIALGNRLLKRGMVGSDIKALQELLMQLGYALPKYGADAKFGAETEKALRAFQKEAGLTVDGKYGDRILTISSWITRFMMRLKLVSTM